jgi:phosphate transport system substrate-binding protein
MCGQKGPMDATYLTNFSWRIPLKVTHKIQALAVAALVTVAVSGCKPGSQSVSLVGAGSTFVYPVMTRWTSDFQAKNSNVQINYQSIGSGGGIQQVKAGTVDFGASDAPLNDAALGAMAPVVQIPESAGPVAVIYNLPTLKAPVKLSPEVLAGIFLGTIKTWQDPKIKADNPGVDLPTANVLVVHRAEGSGTSNIFTTYLSAVSDEWKTKVGKGSQVSWPTGNGGKGSEGVTGQVRQSPGAIGYVDLTYALQNNLPVASIKNQAGNYVAPTAAGASSAIASFAPQLAKDVRTPVVNPPASAGDAYPITGLTFFIIPKDGADVAKRTALRNFIQYVVGSDGQATAASLNYAPLPDAIKQQDLETLKTITAGGQPIP